jgi:hypothetical protein
MAWKDNAIGLFTRKAGWTNPDFDFIIAYAGGEWSKRLDGAMELAPNPQLKPIEEQAHKEGKPVIALWDFEVSHYALNQIDANETRWPDEAHDYPLQALIEALRYRNIDGLIIRVMNGKNRLGGSESPMYVAFAAGKFIERANKWLYSHKGLHQQTVVLTNDDFLRTNGQQEYFYRWLKNWQIGIEQQAILPLAAGAWPQDSDAIRAIPPSLGWKFWYHYNAAALDMMIFNGPDAACRDFLGYKGGTDTSNPPPVIVPDPVKALEEQVKALAARADAMEQLTGELLTRVEVVEGWKQYIEGLSLKQPEI